MPFSIKKIINKVEKLFKLCCGTRTFEKIETKWDFSHMDLSKASPKFKKWKTMGCVKPPPPTPHERDPLPNQHLRWREGPRIKRGWISRRLKRAFLEKNEGVWMRSQKMTIKEEDEPHNNHQKYHHPHHQCPPQNHPNTSQTASHIEYWAWLQCGRWGSWRSGWRTSAGVRS